MKELVVISGKGGTGKTSLMAAFAAMAQNAVFCDADVDAADLHLLLAPDIRQRQDFMGGGQAVIRPDRCTQCGLCMDLCRFGAVKPDFEVDPIACEGCGVCVDLCPEKAIDFSPQTCGEWFISETRFGPMVHARLGIAEENSGKLVTLVRKETRNMAETRGLELILTDGPPGVGCPVIASIGGATALLIVAEPTLSGAHDLRRVADLAAHFKVPGMVCVNKSDVNPGQSDEIAAIAKEKGLAFVGKIPFDPMFTQAMIHGKPLPEYQPDSAAGKSVRDIWQNVQEVLSKINGSVS